MAVLDVEMFGDPRGLSCMPTPGEEIASRFEAQGGLMLAVRVGPKGLLRSGIRSKKVREAKGARTVQ